MKRWLRGAALGLAGGLLLALLVVLAALWFAEDLLEVSVPRKQADCLVMLGGEWFSRPDKIAELYTNGVARRIIITGFGDADYMREKFEARGVPWSVVSLEQEAETTLQNAQRTVEMLRARDAKSAMIVTSCFHSRRALATFRKVAPDLEFGMAPSHRGFHTLREYWMYEAKFVLLEYPKLGWYWVRHGISPFPEDL